MSTLRSLLRHFGNAGAVSNALAAAELRRRDDEVASALAARTAPVAEVAVAA